MPKFAETNIVLDDNEALEASASFELPGYCRPGSVYLVVKAGSYDVTFTLPYSQRQAAEHIAGAFGEAYSVQAPADDQPVITDAEVEAAHAAWADLYYDGCQWRTTFGDATLAGQRQQMRAALEAAAKVAQAESKRRAA